MRFPEPVAEGQLYRFANSVSRSFKSINKLSIRALHALECVFVSSLRIASCIFCIQNMREFYICVRENLVFSLSEKNIVLIARFYDNFF